MRKLTAAALLSLIALASSGCYNIRWTDQRAHNLLPTCATERLMRCGR